MRLAGCASAVDDADAGPNCGGSFYTDPNIDVGQINPPLPTKAGSGQNGIDDPKSHDGDFYTNL
jgi:hypothetical protein